MSAIQAELIQYRTFKKTPYMEIVLSVPIEREREVKEALGYLKPGESVWCAVARLYPDAVRQEEDVVIPKFLRAEESHA